MSAALKGLIALALLLLGAWLGYSWRDNEAEAQLMRIHLAHEKATTKAVREALGHAHTVQEALDAEHTRALELQAALRRSGAAGQRLHDELQATREWGLGLNSELAESRAAAGQAVAVLADLLGRCSDRRRELAEYADRAASAGQTCVDAWPREGLRVTP